MKRNVIDVGLQEKNLEESKKMKNKINLKVLICNWIICKCLSYLNKQHVLLFETTAFNNKTIEAFLVKKGYVLHNDGWFIKGFVYVRLCNDCIEISTVSRSNPKHIYLSPVSFSVELYLNNYYIKKLSNA